MAHPLPLTPADTASAVPLYRPTYEKWMAQAGRERAAVTVPEDACPMCDTPVDEAGFCHRCGEPVL